MTHIKTQNSNGSEILNLTCLQTNMATSSLHELDTAQEAIDLRFDKLVRDNGGPLPGLRGYRCEIRPGFGYAAYKIERKHDIAVVGILAWSEDAEPLAWRSSQIAAAQLGPIPIVFDNSEVGGLIPPHADKPESLPWLASSLQPGVTSCPAIDLCDLGQIERMLAAAILASARRGELRHQVFGPVH